MIRTALLFTKPFVQNVRHFMQSFWLRVPLIVWAPDLLPDVAFYCTQTQINCYS